MYICPVKHNTDSIRVSFRFQVKYKITKKVHASIVQVILLLTYLIHCKVLLMFMLKVYCIFVQIRYCKSNTTFSLAIGVR